MIRSLQACRAAAALLVVLLHTSGGICALPKYFASRPFGHFFEFGGAGVDFFFVLSGFIITHVHARDVGHPKQLGAYLWKRLTRIYPTYWAALLPLLPVFFLVPAFGTGRDRDPWNIVCSILLIPQSAGGPILGVAWSLCYEVFFYSLFAILIVSRRWGIAVWSVWLAAVIAGAFGVLTAFPWTFLGSLYHLQFLAGVLVALALPRITVRAPRSIAACGVALFLTTGMIEVYLRPLSMAEHVLGYTTGSVLIMVGVIGAERAGLLHAPRWLIFLGDASYSIYLVHFPALSVLAKLVQKLRLDGWVSSPVLFCLLTATSVVVGCAFHLAVERPLLNLFRLRVRGSARPAANPQAEEPPRKAA
jgi:exopolysaccharide production protein ExoZ